jgi:hypothetical protein
MRMKRKIISKKKKKKKKRNCIEMLKKKEANHNFLRGVNTADFVTEKKWTIQL